MNSLIPTGKAVSAVVIGVSLIGFAFYQFPDAPGIREVRKGFQGLL